MRKISHGWCSSQPPGDKHTHEITSGIDVLTMIKALDGEWKTDKPVGVSACPWHMVNRLGDSKWKII